MHVQDKESLYTSPKFRADKVGCSQDGRVMLQVVEGCAAEEAEACSIIPAAVNAASPHGAVAGLQEHGVQALNLSLPYFHFCVVPPEAG